MMKRVHVKDRSNSTKLDMKKLKQQEVRNRLKAKLNVHRSIEDENEFIIDEAKRMTKHLTVCKECGEMGKNFSKFEPSVCFECLERTLIESQGCYHNINFNRKMPGCCDDCSSGLEDEQGNFEKIQVTTLDSKRCIHCLVDGRKCYADGEAECAHTYQDEGHPKFVWFYLEVSTFCHWKEEETTQIEPFCESCFIKWAKESDDFLESSTEED